jgi:predicted CXXCH cytochrome family protein
MKSSIAAAIAFVPAAALLFASTPARSEINTSGSLGADPESSCLLGRVNREAATNRLCLSCHDGTLGSFHIGSTTGPGADHPVDVVYALAVARNPRLRTRYELSRRLALPDGKVTCVTCHDGASPEPNHTAVSMHRSALCFSCHAV